LRFLGSRKTRSPGILLLQIPGPDPSFPDSPVVNSKILFFDRFPGSSPTFGDSFPLPGPAPGFRTPFNHPPFFPVVPSLGPGLSREVVPSPSGPCKLFDFSTGRVSFYFPSFPPRRGNVFPHGLWRKRCPPSPVKSACVALSSFSDTVLSGTTEVPRHQGDLVLEAPPFTLFPTLSTPSVPLFLYGILPRLYFAWQNVSSSDPSCDCRAVFFGLFPGILSFNGPPAPPSHHRVPGFI